MFRRVLEISFFSFSPSRYIEFHSLVNKTEMGTVSKATLGKHLRYRVDAYGVDAYGVDASIAWA